MRNASIAERKTSEPIGSGEVRQIVVRLACSPIVIAAAAMALRLVILYVTWHRGSPAGRSGPFGYELGCIAKSIASGRGFSSPEPFLDTGPTAWHAPVYPYVLAGIFKVWGIYSAKSQLINEALNCLFSALIIFPVFGIARRSFGSQAAVVAAWMWVILPSAWHVPIADAGYTTLSALLVAVIFWNTLWLADGGGMAIWGGYGALWAVAALTNPSILAAMPFLFTWLVWQRDKRLHSWRRNVATALVVFIIGMAPWTIRNYVVFGRFVPVRSVLGITLWMGNNGVAEGVNSFRMLPIFNLAEAEKFKRMGEIKYARAKGREAVDYMGAHPLSTIGHMSRNVVSFWLSVSDRPNQSWATDPLYVRALLGLNVLILVFAGVGIKRAWECKDPQAVAYLLVLLTFPIIYYVTYALVRFRFPIESLVAVLAGYGITRRFPWFSASSTKVQSS